MKKVKKLLIFLLVSVFCFAQHSSLASEFWVNDLRTLFVTNKTVIYALNVRNFNALDKNGNDIIEITQNEKRGSFLNAVARLDELVSYGANTIYLLPITKTGKLKALGTAGSLYSLDSFDVLNPQLDDPDNPASVFDEAVLFVSEAHKRGLRVMVDLPSCGSYDMSLERPQLFVTDKSGKTVIPSDWTDVRLFRVYESDGTLNQELVEGYKKIIDLMLSLNIDGIRADVAAIKPYEFWKEIIDYTRKKSPQFLFLAEAASSWTNPAPGYATYTPLEKLLEAGFDGHYGDYGKFSTFKKGTELTSLVQNNLAISKKFSNQKSTMASFATHDQVSPVLVGNVRYWEMITWLNVTLPLNSYTLDGFVTGDTYIYKYENQKADRTFTDDDTYFVHRGKFDIFNFSRMPKGSWDALKDQYIKAMKFKYWAKNILVDGSFSPLRSSNKSVFAFSRNKNEDSIIVVGNLDGINTQNTTVHVPKITKKSFISPVKMTEAPILNRGNMRIELQPYEIQVFIITKEQESKKK